VLSWGRRLSQSETAGYRCRSLPDHPLGCQAAITKLLDGRRGKNTRHKLSGLFRQSVFGRLAGYEDVNDAERLARDPAMRAIVGREGLDRAAASSSQMGRLETEWLATDANLEALTDLSGAWIDRVHERKPPDSIILDMDSSESPTHGEQEGSVWNGHFGCTCYHPLFVFNQYGDLERSRLRPGNVHSAEDWRLVLEPVIARYRERGVDLYFRADAAFAKPKIYELLEAEGIRYAIRLPANQVLQRRVVHLLTRPVGHPRSRSCPTPASTTRPPAGPEPVGSWPRSSGTRANSTQGSASSSIYDAGFPVITKVMILPPYGRVDNCGSFKRWLVWS
jgi:hypothetical protein